MIVTVQVDDPHEESDVGLHASDVIPVAVVKVIEVDCDAPFRLAVNMADCCAVTKPAVAEKIAEVAPAGTLTEEGTLKVWLLLVSVTLIPP